MTEAILQDRVLWLAQARQAAAAIAREKGSVTIDDVRALCPPPDTADPRILGRVFHDERFARIGFRNSARRACHGRPIGIFCLRN